jgi:hypothetical protein
MNVCIYYIYLYIFYAAKMIAWTVFIDQKFPDLIAARFVIRCEFAEQNVFYLH